MGEDKQIRWISGFWNRIAALIIDCILLGIVGQTLGLILGEFFVKIGVWGLVIGFAIAMAYFGILNSKLGHGQTLGKRILKLRVVDSNNEPIELVKSLARYCILAIPYFLTGEQIPDEVWTPPWIYIWFMLSLGGGFSILYLYSFNRVTRQSLHDIAVGSYVVNVGAEKEAVSSVGEVHYFVVGIIFVAAAFAPTFIIELEKQEWFIAQMKSSTDLMEHPSVRHATITSGISIVSTAESTTETTNVNAKVLLINDDTSDVELARSLAVSIISSYPESLEKDFIQVNLRYGYDIGIASHWNAHEHKFSPNELLNYR